MDNFIVARCKDLLRTADSLAWLAPLVMRLYFGYFWAETGWAKLHNLEGATQRFVDWGIPFPEFSAPFSAAAELIGGLLTMLGLFTRLISIPMMINMLVALVTVVAAKWSNSDEFFESDEVLYIVIYFWLMMAGPGKVSLDHLLFGKMFQRPLIIKGTSD